MKKKYINKLCKWLILLTCIFAFRFNAIAGGKLQSSQYEEKQPRINYTLRVENYLDQQTKGWLKKMAVKEKFLLQMVRSIAAEIRQRDPSTVMDDDVAFRVIYGKQDLLIEQYSVEIENIVSLIRELENLERYVGRTENLKIIEEIGDLKSHLGAVIENRNLYKKKIYTKREAANLIQEYSVEIDTLLKIYDQLNQFERIALQKDDQEVIKSIQEQKQRLVRIIGMWSPEGDAEFQDNLVEEYMNEAEKVVEILKQIDQLAGASARDSIDVSKEIETARNDLVQSIDQRFLNLFGYKGQKKYKGPSIFEYVKQWKAKKYAEFSARLVQYRILKQRLITTGKTNERNRMLEADMSDALLDYAAKDYDLAEIQFKEILKNYAEYYPNMDGVNYYICEANFARSYFDVAFTGYSKLVDNYPQSKYVPRSLWKMMFVSFTYGWKSKFYKYFEQLDQRTAALNEEEMSKAYYLAGYVYSQDNRFKKARRVLEKIPDNSRYYHPGQYLLGIVFVNLDNYSKAKKIYSKLVETESYPWSDMNSAMLRNDALIKLGYIHYQRGEYEKAIAIFNRVSKGYGDYDQSLIAQAWANLKTGKYEASIDKVNHLFGEYLSSNYTYEALVLSAHCKRILNQSDAAKDDLKYITKARGVFELSKKYNEERRRIIEQSKELDRLEATILERQDEILYPGIEKVRNTINEALLAFSNHGTAGSILIRQFNDKRREIVRQINQLDGMIKTAHADGNVDGVQKAEQQRSRLVAMLETYKTDESLSKANYFIEYPLATKEGGIVYRKGVVNNMIREMVDEKKRLEADIAEVMKFLAQMETKGNIQSSVDLEILEEDLQDLQNRLNRLQIWLTQNEVEEINTNFDQWASYSGFGLSDINFSSLKEKNDKIVAYSQNISMVDEVLRRKKEVLERKVEHFNKQMSKIEKKIERDRVRIEKLERQKYFQNIYFDSKQKEVEKRAEDEEFERMMEEELRRKDFGGKKVEEDSSLSK